MNTSVPFSTLMRILYLVPKKIRQAVEDSQEFGDIYLQPKLHSERDVPRFSDMSDKFLRVVVSRAFFTWDGQRKEQHEIPPDEFRDKMLAYMALNFDNMDEEAEEWAQHLNNLGKGCGRPLYSYTEPDKRFFVRLCLLFNELQTVRAFTPPPPENTADSEDDSEDDPTPTEIAFERFLGLKKLPPLKRTPSPWSLGVVRTLGWILHKCVYARYTPDCTYYIHHSIVMIVLRRVYIITQTVETSAKVLAELKILITRLSGDGHETFGPCVHRISSVWWDYKFSRCRPGVETSENDLAKKFCNYYYLEPHTADGSAVVATLHGSISIPNFASDKHHAAWYHAYRLRVHMQWIDRDMGYNPLNIDRS